MEYTKLLPGIRQMIDEDKNTYPHFTEALLRDIESAEFCSDLKVKTATIIVDYYKDLGNESRNNFELDLYAAFGMYQG